MIHKAKIPFDWDHPTNIANQAKYGVSLREASVLFTCGADYLEIFDKAQAASRERTLAIGAISLGVVLVVAIERSVDTVRIFSARWATPYEYQKYFKYIERRT